MTFDEAYTKEAKLRFNDRQQLERQVSPTAPWEPCPPDLQAGIYRDIDSDRAVELAMGLKIADGSMVRFRIDIGNGRAAKAARVERPK